MFACNKMKDEFNNVILTVFSTPQDKICSELPLGDL